MCKWYFQCTAVLFVGFFHFFVCTTADSATQLEAVVNALNQVKQTIKKGEVLEDATKSDLHTILLHSYRKKTDKYMRKVFSCIIKSKNYFHNAEQKRALNYKKVFHGLTVFLGGFIGACMIYWQENRSIYPPQNNLLFSLLITSVVGVVGSGIYLIVHALKDPLYYKRKIDNIERIKKESNDMWDEEGKKILDVCMPSVSEERR